MNQVRIQINNLIFNVNIVETRLQVWFFITTLTVLPGPSQSNQLGLRSDHELPTFSL